MYLSSCNTPKIPNMMGDGGGGPSNRKGVLDSNRWILFVLTTSLMLFITLWLMFFHVSDDGLYYPIYSKNQNLIPEEWVQRAIIYNTYEFNEYTPYQIISPGYEKVQGAKSNNTQKKLVCYYNFPPENVTSLKILQPEALDAFLCTHINLAFATIENCTISLDENNLEAARTVMKLKEINDDLKVLLSIGGATQESGFPDMVVNHENRKRFIKSIVEYVKIHKFDGIDLDWEFPNRDTTKNSKERMHFTQLLYEIRNEINRQEKHKFLLSVAVPAPVFLIDVGYDVSYLNNYVDYVNVMSYDYHFFTKLTPLTGINAPLYSRENDLGFFLTLNINYTVHYWMYKGLARDKLVVGLPTFGHTFRLVNVHNHGINSPVNGYGSLGGAGFVSYPEVCTFLKRNQISPMFDLSTRSPFATKNHEWISFDDNQSLTFKAEFVKDHKFAGAMVYSLNTDDHQMICDDDNSMNFPLTRKIKEVLNSRKKYYQY